MVGVASQIVFCIFAAAVIGSVAGYLIGHIRHNARIADVEKLWKAKLDQRDGEIAGLREGGASTSINSEYRSDTNLVDSQATTSDSREIESRLSQAFNLIDNLTRSQERMESELAALRAGTNAEFKLEPSAPKS